MVNHPSSLLAGEGGVLSLAVDARAFASFSRAVGGMMKQEGTKYGQLFRRASSTMGNVTFDATAKVTCPTSTSSFI